MGNNKSVGRAKSYDTDSRGSSVDRFESGSQQSDMP